MARNAVLHVFFRFFVSIFFYMIGLIRVGCDWIGLVVFSYSLTLNNWPMTKRTNDHLHPWVRKTE